MMLVVACEREALEGGQERKLRKACRFGASKRLYPQEQQRPDVERSLMDEIDDDSN
jgi:hypothetical protein